LIKVTVYLLTDRSLSDCMYNRG